MINVVNLQRKVPIDTASIRDFSTRLSESVQEAKGDTISIAFVSDRRMKQLNGFFRGKDETTDVLSFPYGSDEFESTGDGFNRSKTRTPEGGTINFLGDIVISAEQAERQAAENGLTFENEIKQLILHGMLHLCGYDHETDDGEMNARELDLRQRLRI